MKSNTKWKWMAPLALAAVVTAGCEFTQPAPPSGVTVLLTDAPHPNVEEAWVRVDGIYLQGTGGQEWLLQDKTEWIELTELAGETTATLVEGVEIAPGTYGQMRFMVTEAYLVSKDGRTYATSQATLPDGVTADGVLLTPSFEQTGIKVSMPNGGVTVDGEEGTVIVVDYDVARSFGQRAGASGQWVMRPALRATEFAISGNIRGTVSLDDEVEFPADEMCGGYTIDLSSFVPTATQGETTASGGVEAEVNEDGSYLIAFVHPGPFTMGFKNELLLANEDEDWTVTFAADHPTEVTVPQAGSATADYVITEISCEEVPADED